MADRDIIRVKQPDKELETVLAQMFRDMYREMQQAGLLLPLDDTGEEKWLHSVKKTLGRFSVLVISRKEDKIEGFAHGALKFTPDYLGSQKVGVVTHIYVKTDARNSGAGEGMLAELDQWFHEQQVHSIELQVLAGNSEGIRFWERSGFSHELLQYRKIIR